MTTSNFLSERLPPEVPQQSLNKKNKKLYSNEYIAQIKSALKDSPDGRYEKRREGKKSGETSRATITMQDIFKEAKPEALHGVIKLNNKFYAISDTVGKGTFGEAKLAQDLDTGEWFVVKIQEAKKETIEPEEKPGRRRLGAVRKQKTGASQREVGAEEILAKAKMEIKVLEAIQQGTGAEEVIARELERSGQQKIQYIIVMKYIHGETARELIDKLQTGEISLSPLEKLTIASHFMKTLFELKDKGFYHCDISPGNIKIDRETGEVKLLDYANASPIATPMTQEEESNTPAMMASPEGTRGYRPTEASSRPTEKSEIYSAGVVLAQLLEFAMLDTDENPPVLRWKNQNEFKDAMLQQAYDYVKKMTAMSSDWMDEEETQKAVVMRPTMQEANEYFAKLLQAEIKLNHLPPLSKHGHFGQKTSTVEESVAQQPQGGVKPTKGN